MHPFCGRPIGEEGYGQPIRCRFCDNKDNHHKITKEPEEKLSFEENLNKLEAKQKLLQKKK